MFDLEFIAQKIAQLPVGESKTVEVPLKNMFTEYILQAEKSGVTVHDIQYLAETNEFKVHLTRRSIPTIIDSFWMRFPLDQATSITSDILKEIQFANNYFHIHNCSMTMHVKEVNADGHLEQTLVATFTKYQDENDEPDFSNWDMNPILEGKRIRIGCVNPKKNRLKHRTRLHNEFRVLVDNSKFPDVIAGHGLGKPIPDYYKLKTNEPVVYFNPNNPRHRAIHYSDQKNFNARYKNKKIPSI